ncbi:MAG: hypothetical protein J6T57_03540 [Alphaproteobacteria bacterium]|nr:hypothetical protein [Alphaproteobacteria bacterium]
MYSTIINMQTNVKPYHVTIVPLYSANDPITVIVSDKQNDVVHDKFACGDTVNYEKDKNLLLGVHNGKEYGYDRMLVEDIEDGVEINGVKYQNFHLFGGDFGYQMVKMYSNPYKIRIGNEVLVEKEPDGFNYKILHNFSIAEQRKKFFDKTR